MDPLGSLVTTNWITFVYPKTLTNHIGCTLANHDMEWIPKVPPKKSTEICPNKSTQEFPGSAFRETFCSLESPFFKGKFPAAKSSACSLLSEAAPKNLVSKWSINKREWKTPSRERNNLQQRKFDTSHWVSFFWKFRIPYHPCRLVYLATFTTKINQMYLNRPFHASYGYENHLGSFQILSGRFRLQQWSRYYGILRWMAGHDSQGWWLNRWTILQKIMQQRHNDG